MSDIYHMFRDLHKTSLEGADLSAIPEKYLNSRKLYDRFLPVIETVKTFGFTGGLDFGCGVGAATVLASLLGVSLVGVDIPNYPDGPNPYSVVHANLIKMGYPIRIFDTARFPWDFANNQFQFLLGFCSIGKDNSPTSEKDKATMQQAEWVNKRLAELVRITKRKGVWFLGPKATISFVRQNRSFKGAVKSILLKEWPV